MNVSRSWYVPGSHRPVDTDSFLVDPEFDSFTDAIFAEIELAASQFDGDGDE